MNPTNVFIIPNDVIKILDFNVSKLADKEHYISNNFHLFGEVNKQVEEGGENEEVKSEKGKFKFSLFTKTGTPIYTAPEMHSSFRYS